MRTAEQIKALIRNYAKENRVDAQILLRNYMLERLLERISLSRYKRHFVLKGGLLIAAMVGLESRSTIDMDITIKGYPLSEKLLSEMFDEILHLPLNDGVSITLLGINKILEESDYECYRMSLLARIDNTEIPIKVDVTTGDIITPEETRYRFNLLLESRVIDIFAYNLETVLAEKMETVMSRGVLNTRMRDFYDIHILTTLQSHNINYSLLAEAFEATTAKRGSGPLRDSLTSDLEKVLTDAETLRLWGNYRKKFSYAADLEWDSVSASVRAIFANICKTAPS